MMIIVAIITHPICVPKHTQTMDVRETAGRHAGDATFRCIVIARKMRETSGTCADGRVAGTKNNRVNHS